MLITGMHKFLLKSHYHCCYRFTLVDIGQAGRFSDGGVFSNSQFGDALEYNELNIPDPRCLPGSTKFPYVLVGDEAFPLKTYLLRPFPWQNLPGSINSKAMYYI